LQEASKFFTEFNASHDGGELHLEVLSSGVITEEEISWLVEKQQQFTRLEEATALRLGRLLDRGFSTEETSRWVVVSGPASPRGKAISN